MEKVEGNYVPYEKQNFKNGQVLTAEHLNYMEDGIVAAGRLTDEQMAEIIEAVLTEICGRLQVR